jgi:hypothetical protein
MAPGAVESCEYKKLYIRRNIRIVGFRKNTCRVHVQMPWNALYVVIPLRYLLPYAPMRPFSFFI